MVRRTVLALACFTLFACSPSFAPFSRSIPFLGFQHSTVFSALRWCVALCLVVEVNAALNRIAENGWRWTDDRSAWNWANEVAVVTGGSNGIGAKVVQELVARGIKVAVLDVEPLSEELQNDKRNLITYYHCDITSRTAVHVAGEAIRSDLGPPSILINNAGIGNGLNVLDLSPERLRAIFDVNLLSHWFTVQEFLPAMIQAKKGHILSTASLAAFVGLAGSIDYSATKAGLIAFHEGLTQELKHRYKCPQIKTTIVYPNWTRTRLIQSITSSLQNMGAPIVEPQDVARAMVKRIYEARSGQLILGPRLAASVRALPIWIQELIRDRLASAVRPS